MLKRGISGTFVVGSWVLLLLTAAITTPSVSNNDKQSSIWWVSAMKPPHQAPVKQQHRTESSPLFGASCRSRATGAFSSRSRVHHHHNIISSQPSPPSNNKKIPPVARKGRIVHRKNNASIQLSSTDIETKASRFDGFPPIMTPQWAAVSMTSWLISERRRRPQHHPRQQQGNQRVHQRPTTTASSLRGGSSTILMASASSIVPSSIAPSSWIFPAVACATSYALYNLFIKKASDSMDPILGGVLLQFVAALIGTILWVGQRALIATSSGGASSTAATLITKSGVLWSVAAGVAVGAAEILSFIVSGRGVPATQSIPIIVGGSILVGTLLGAAWLQERLSKTGWMGVVLIAAGIALVGWDGVGGH